MINPAIIREYDIRGVYNDTLTENDAFLVGWSFTRALNKNNSVVNVCRDGRLSSPALLEALIKGLNAGGANVVNIGVGPTPMLYFSTFHETVADAGIMVTGSHNPPEYNGFKFIVNRQPFFGEEIKNLQEISQTYSQSSSINKQSSSQDFVNLYVDMLCRTVCNIDNMKIAWDAGNGSTGEIIEKLCQKLPGTHILLNSKIDGNFPSHHPDPTIAKNLEQLISTVKAEKCDLGLAFDGDGDRLGVVDNNGNIIWGDQILFILAQDILSRIPGAPIIADVKTSQVIFNMIEQHGGKPIMWKTGHSNIKKHMKDISSPLAGEMSGHIFISDQYHGYDDALYAAVRLINIIKDKKINEILREIPSTYNTPEIRIECEDDKKFTVIEKLKKYFQQNKIKFNDIDGIRYSQSNDSWGLIRASNTQAVLVCRFEGATKDKVEKEIDFITNLLKEYDLSLVKEEVLING